MKFKTEILEALKQTSVKGIPMLLKAEAVHLKVLWTCAVLAFFATGFYQSYQLIVEYISYPKLTFTKEIIPKDVSVPIVQVCNINSFGLMRNMPQNQTFQHHQELAQNVTKCTNCSSTTRKLLLDVTHNLISPYGYIINIGPNNTLKLLPDYTDFLIECVAFTSAQMMGLNCENVGKIEIIPSWDYLVCLRFTTPKETKMEELSMTFYIDSCDECHEEYNSRNKNVKLSSGVAFSLLETDFEFGSSSPELTAPPGTMTTAKVAKHTTKRLGKPYGLCTANGTKYSPRDCKMQCWIDYSLKDCNCIDTLDWKSEISKDLVPCAYISASQSELLQYLKCKNQVPKMVEEKCICAQPCSEVHYTFEISNTKWPLTSHYASFYNKLIKQKHFSMKFSSMSDTNKTVSLKMKQLVKNNFVKIVLKPTFEVIHGKIEVPKYSLFSFIGNLGGCLNLWTGITVVVLVEILQVLIYVFQMCFTSEMKTSKWCSFVHTDSLFDVCAKSYNNFRADVKWDQFFCSK